MNEQRSEDQGTELQRGEIHVRAASDACAKAHMYNVGECVACQRDQLKARVRQLEASLKRYTDWFECMAASMEKLSEQERRKP